MSSTAAGRRCRRCTFQTICAINHHHRLVSIIEHTVVIHTVHFALDSDFRRAVAYIVNNRNDSYANCDLRLPCILSEKIIYKMDAYRTKNWTKPYLVACRTSWLQRFRMMSTTIDASVPDRNRWDRRVTHRISYTQSMPDAIRLSIRRRRHASANDPTSSLRINSWH